MIRISRDIIHLMRDQYNRQTFVDMELIEHIHDFPSARRIQSCRWFIQNQHFRLHGQYAGYRYASHLTP